MLASVLTALPVHAQQAPDFDAIGRMSCPQLEQERQRLRRDLTRMQHPEGLDDPLWTRVSNAHNLVNYRIRDGCRALTVQDFTPPDPPKVALMPEKQQVDVAMKALKNGRLRAAQDLLLQGSLAGYSSAQYNLGMVLYVSGDRDASERWLRSAAQQGHVEAARMLESTRSSKK